MTRREFINDICDWGDLKDFCYEHGCDLLDCVTTDDGRDDWVNEEVDYYQRYEGWRALADFLYNLPQDRYDWWERDNDGDWYGLNDGSDFDRYKNDVLEWFDENGLFDSDGNDSEEAPEDEDEFIEEEAEEDFEPEDFGFDDLFSDAAAVLANETARAGEREAELKRVLQEERDAELARVAEEAENFNSFVSAFAQAI